MKIFDHKILKNSIYSLIVFTFIAPILLKASDNDIEEILVVGSRINNENLKKILPVTIINSEEIKVLGIDSGDDLIMSLTENGTNRFNDAGNAIAGVNSARGDMGAFNLRNLGTGNTLVLMNGRRLINSPSFQSESVGGSFVPVNSVNTNIIPVNGIERVEVLRDGSSAIYGADAVAGVINFVTKKNKEGFEFNFKNSEFENIITIDSDGQNPPEEIIKMIEDETITGGMIPKINTCLDAINNGVTGVVIVDGRKPHSILFEIFSDKGAGTLIRK